MANYVSKDQITSKKSRDDSKIMNVNVNLIG
jgi:hypothetical protein